MGLFTRGDIVVAPLDFSDFSNYKAGQIKEKKLAEVVNKIVTMLQT